MISPWIWKKDTPYTLNEEPVTSCDYDEAAFMKGISPSDAERLEEMRPKIFDLKICILKILARALTNKSLTDLWEEVH